MEILAAPFLSGDRCSSGQKEMKFLIEPGETGWVAAKEELNEVALAANILSCNICVSDLDETDAESPAKEIARKAIGTSYLRPAYWGWCLRTKRALEREGKKVEGERWRKYGELFLRKKRGIKKAGEYFNEKRVREFLYPGVEEFYGILGRRYKVYLTRNIREVGEKFGGVLGFDEVQGEVLDKAKALEEFVKGHPFDWYLVKGDSEEDEEMLEVLKYFLRKRKIQGYFGCYVAEEAGEGKMNPNFGVNIGRDYSGLVEILKNQ